MAKVSCQVKLLGLKLSFLVIANVKSSLKFQMSFCKIRGNKINNTTQMVAKESRVGKECVP